MERTTLVVMDVDKNYYDIRDILACKQSLKCLFSNPIPRGKLFFLSSYQEYALQQQFLVYTIIFLILEIFHLIGQRVPDMEGGFCRADLPLFMIRTLPNCKVRLLFEFYHKKKILSIKYDAYRSYRQPNSVPYKCKFCVQHQNMSM